MTTLQNDNNKPLILAVVGPTACGKTALSVRLARALGAEVICCDSMQIYRGMPIGTAAPTKEEQGSVPHHLFDCIEPTAPYSCAAYVADAEKAVQDVLSRGALPLFCGGTGLYLDAFLRGAPFEETKTDDALRHELEAYLAAHGPDGLHALLASLDPAAAAAVHPNNTKRVLRAIEIYRLTGKTKTEWDAASRTVPSPYRTAVIGLRYDNRDLLYARINARVDAMMAQGLPDETRRLDEAGVFAANATAAQAIGYKELLGYIHGQETQEQAVEELKQATRRYAKRQMTWFSAKDYVHWITVDENGTQASTDALLEQALAIVNAAR